MQAICRFGRDAARRGHHGARRGTREGHHAPARGRRVVGCTNRGAPRARGHTLVGFDPWLVASPSAPAALGAATASTLPLGLRLHPSFIGRVGRARLRLSAHRRLRRHPPWSGDGGRRRQRPATVGGDWGLEQSHGVALHPPFRACRRCLRLLPRAALRFLGIGDPRLCPRPAEGNPLSPHRHRFFVGGCLVDDEPMKRGDATVATLTPTFSSPVSAPSRGGDREAGPGWVCDRYPAVSLSALALMRWGLEWADPDTRLLPPGYFSSFLSLF
ncbi:uncharacterized protein LOC123449234 [Hordeum vulgare subsp. vulgare]|uniref:Predicted protein n=1 Tax=Hordeum vulgare subsp. vulgare TaxID=112509 RepID=F2CWJ5_HORVV|nr:uncharacterized protein LOC123449234 [Hordeum vulgare subsp. vulgare]BAJ87216.1 predicted protein [Hordeum vulgare subsp. vulgare]